MAKGYKIRLDIQRTKAVFTRLDYGARGGLYRSAKVEMKREEFPAALESTKVLEDLATAAGQS